ncbi:MAG TPA: outer membrane lipoprotein-sorting protein [Verrucomicrobiota bacterium]|nr:outer membrane lipoprotein-sorting protein [Verrucomicrobiota bacterium]
MNLRIILRARLALAIAIALAPSLASSAEQTPAEAEGRLLAAELRSQRPEEPLSSGGVLRTRDSYGRWREAIPVRLEIAPGAQHWQTRYWALGAGQEPFETLTVTHAEGAPTRYDHSRALGTAVVSDAVTLTGDAAAVPFAGSEFWLSDLGLEFLDWPGQQVVRSEMRKGRSCKVLESLNPNPSSTNYARVLSWIDIEHRGILRAEGYDRERRLLKEFSIGSFKKVQGRWQLKSMEIRNEATDARTRIEFDLEIEDR